MTERGGGGERGDSKSERGDGGGASATHRCSIQVSQASTSWASGASRTALPIDKLSGERKKGREWGVTKGSKGF